MRYDTMAKLLAAQGCTSRPVYCPGSRILIKGYNLISPNGTMKRVVANPRTGLIDGAAVKQWLARIAIAQANADALLRRWAQLQERN
jgi:hypothetical protein